MADYCYGRGAGTSACRGGDDHIRRVAGAVALEKAKVERKIYTVRRPDYTAEEWRLWRGRPKLGYCHPDEGGK